MTNTEPATPGPIPPPPPRSGHGCLWGCLGAALLAIVVIGGSVGYFGWYLYSGFKSDATLQSVMRVVSGDQIARAVLGDDIAVTNLESSSVNADLSSKTNSYVAHLKGSKGEGTLAVTVVTPHGGKATITTLLLTGPDGHQYNLQTGGDGIPGPTNIDHKSRDAPDQSGDTGQPRNEGQSGDGAKGPAGGDQGGQSGSGSDDSGGDVGQGGSHSDPGDGGQDGGNDDGGRDGGQNGGGNSHPRNNDNQPI